MIPEDLMVILIISATCAILMDYLSGALKVRGLNKAFAQLKISPLTQVASSAVSLESKDIRKRALSLEDNDSQAAFLRLTSQIESNLEELVASIPGATIGLSAPKTMKLLLNNQIVDSILSDAFDNIWYARTRLIHCDVLDEQELSLATDLASILLLVLSSLNTRDQSVRGKPERANLSSC
jgi:hypothetical protein